MTEFDEEFEQVSSGASDTYPLSAGSVKMNGHMVFNGRPCKTGKHGHAKANITGIDIFNGKKYEDVLPTSHNVDIPNIKRSEWQAISVDDDGYLTLMDASGTTRSDLKLPDETDGDAVVAQRLKDGLENGKDVFVTVLYAMGIEKIAEAKEA